MQIEVNRRALLRGLQAAGSVIERRSTAPILTTMLMRANGSLELLGTDLDTERHASVPIVEGVGAGDYLIEDPRGLAAVLKQAGSERVQLVTEDFEGGTRIEWRAGPIATRGQHVMHPTDFPRMFMTPQFVEATVGADFLRAVRRLMPAISTEETRYYLNGIAISHVGGWSYRLAATDGHRLHVAQVELPDATGEHWKGDAIVPRRTLARLLDMLATAKDGARLSFGRSQRGNSDPGKLPDPVPQAGFPNSLTLSTADGAIMSKLIDGTYPDFMRIVPGAAQTTIRAKTADLRRAVAAARAGIATKRSAAVRIDVGAVGQLTVSTKGAEALDTSVAVHCEASASGFYVGFNGDYLMQTLDALGGEVTVMAWDALPGGEGGGLLSATPCKLIDPTDDKFFAVLMPMRV